MLLKTERHDVKAVATCREGLDCLKEFEPAVILLDLMLPGMTGYEFMQEWRKLPHRPKVIILSAVAEYPNGSLEGAYMVLGKTVNPEMMLAIMRKIEEKTRVRQDTADEAVAKAETKQEHEAPRAESTEPGTLRLPVTVSAGGVQVEITRTEPAPEQSRIIASDSKVAPEGVKS